MTETLEAAYARGVADTLALVDDVRALVPTLLPADNRLNLAQLAEGLLHYDPAALATLRPWNVEEALTVKEAARIAGCTPRTVALWAERYRIGRLRVGELRISRPMLLALLDDDALALAALLSGRRDHPAARPYLERAGIGMAA